MSTLNQVEDTAGNAKGTALSHRVFQLHFDLLGFAFHLSWMYLFLYLDEPAGLSDLSQDVLWGQAASYDVSLLFLVITLGAFALFPRQSCALAWKAPLRIATPWLAAGGTGLYYGTVLLAPDALVPLNILSGMATGTGSALLAARWAQCFGLAGTKGVMGTTLPLLTAVIAFCVTIPYLPGPVVMGLIVIFPLLSGLFSARAFGRLSVQDTAIDDHPLASRAAQRRYGIVALGTGLLGLTVGLLGSIANERLSSEYMSTFFITAIAVVLVSNAVYILDKQRAGFLIEFGGPAVALGCVTILAVSLHPTDFFTAFRPIGNVCLEMLFLVVLIIWADRFSLSAARTFAIGRIVYATANFLVTSLGRSFPSAGSTESLIQASSFALFAGVEVVIVAGVLLVALARKKPLVLAPSPEDAASHEDEGTPAATAPRFRAKLDRFAAEHRLTARETDVAEQLIKGRGYARIAVELSIAEGTVNYHTRNVYAKTGVHTREDLIDLFDDFTFDDTAA